MRRRMGPAYERSPAERSGVWIGDNLMRLVATAVAIVAFCLIVNWVVNGLNTLQNRGGLDGSSQAYSTASDAVSGVKLVGAAAIAFVMLKGRTK